jgi:two-component system sensor histidine kinase KdpD
MEALRESEALKTALLRAVSHDLSTPLTAMSLQVDGLRRELGGQGASLARLDALGEQLARLQRRIGNLLSLARLEAGSVAPHPEPTPPPDLFRAARESLPFAAASRELRVGVDAECPDLLVDPSLALEIVVNLLENAHRAAPPGSPIELTAARHPTAPQRVRLGVLDRGPGLPALADRREEIDAGDVLPRGLGLEIARSFAEAHGGTLRLSGRPGGGTCAWVDLPAAAGGEG